MPSRLATVWAPLAVVALIPLFLLTGRDHRIGDPDTFWHIRAGDYLRSSWTFVGPDPWSAFTSHPWVLHEWLPELAFSVADSVAGLGGVAWVWYAGTVLVVVALYAASRSQGSAALSAIATVLALLGTSASLTPRPQLVTIGLSAVVTAAWLGASRDLRPRWWLVPLSWVWACSHGLWFVGPVVGLAAVAGLVLDPARRREGRRLVLVPMLSLLAACLTPAGPALLLAPLSVSAYTRFVSEWDPPSVTSVPVATTLALLGIVALAWLRRWGGRPDTVAIALWLVALAWCLAYTRTVAVAAAMSAPLLVATFRPVVERLDGATRAAHQQNVRHGAAPAADPIRRSEVAVVVTSFLVSLALAAVVIPRSSDVEDRMPIGLAPALASLPAGTVVMDEYGLGGWLRYRFPDLEPVIDERTELYSVAHVERYLAARSARPGWQDSLHAYGATAALLPTDSALADALPRELGWRTIGASEGYVLLRSDPGVPG